MQIEPFEDRVLVEPEEIEESRTKSGKLSLTRRRKSQEQAKLLR